MRILLLIFITAYCSCNQKRNTAIDSKAKALNDSAVFTAAHLHNYSNAVKLLNEATEIDTNYFIAYKNKFSFLGLLKPFDTIKVLQTLKDLNRLRRNDPDYLAKIGLIYLKLNDTTLSHQYLVQASIKYNAMLDTMKMENEYYKELSLEKAFNQILLGEEPNNNAILKKLYLTEGDTTYKELMRQFINKSRKQIIDSLSL